MVKLKKKRWIAGGAVLLLLWVAVIPVSYNLDALLSQRYDYTWNPLRALPLVLQTPKAGLFLLLLLAASALAVVGCLLTGSNIDSHSRIQHITPDIEIPEAAGQGQFGTARFLSKKKYSKVFTAYTLPTDGLYAELLKEGKNDAKAIDKEAE